MINLPRVGDIVHYKSYGTPGGEFTPECRAAVVTEVDEERFDPKIDGIAPLHLSLAVLNPTGMFFNTQVPYAHQSTETGGTWHYQCGEV